LERSLPRNVSSMGANVPWNESSRGVKVLSVDFLLPGTKVQRNEKASIPKNGVTLKTGLGLDLRVELDLRGTLE